MEPDRLCRRRLISGRIDASNNLFGGLGRIFNRNGLGCSERKGFFPETMAEVRY